MSYNYITNKDSPNFTPAKSASAVFGMARKIEGITIHHYGDPANGVNPPAVVDYLCRKNGNTSAHYVATGDNRRVWCIVNPGDVAWHSGSAWGNARTIGIELDPRARAEDYDVAAELVADIRSAFGDVPIYWHSYFVATACPGKWDAAKLDKLSYTKYSHKTDWGKGGNKVTTPTPAPKPAPAPVVELYRIMRGSKQMAAYSVEVNAYKGYELLGSKDVITYKGKDVTATLVKKFAKPSPTIKDPETNKPLPDTGNPVTEKDDYGKENNTLLKAILELLKKLLSVFNLKEK